MHSCCSHSVTVALLLLLHSTTVPRRIQCIQENPSVQCQASFSLPQPASAKSFIPATGQGCCPATGQSATHLQRSRRHIARLQTPSLAADFCSLRRPDSRRLSPHTFYFRIRLDLSWTRPSVNIALDRALGPLQSPLPASYRLLPSPSGIHPACRSRIGNRTNAPPVHFSRNTRRRTPSHDTTLTYPYNLIFT